ncbi:MAG: DUF3467 domain-containing protein [Bacteroidaceae bacterium]|nr:DUF3467 domain-containing protein [Candidatus Equimonas faecalis]MCQ2206478.1 DUF3467 domain-containing protein [Bacteroidaceae bacterium]
MANNNPKENQLQIELRPEQAGGTYANLVILAHSKTEFIADFVAALPGLPKAQVQSRIILAPEHAKRLLFALQENIGKYEQQFGVINVGGQTPQKGGTATPFGIPGGQA